MRILDKKAISRRSFLKGGTATALGLTIAGNMVLGKSSAWAASFDNLGVIMLLLLFRWRETFILMII